MARRGKVPLKNAFLRSSSKNGTMYVFDDHLETYLRKISSNNPLPSEEEARLAKRIKMGDTKAFDTLMKANVRFAVTVAKQYQGQGLPLDDLIQAGNYGLLKAAKRFDYTRGYKFISYAVWWIRQSILEELSEQSRVVRIPINRSARLFQVGKVTDRLRQELQREPFAEEISVDLGIPLGEVVEARALSKKATSFDRPFQGTDDDNFYEIH